MKANASRCRGVVIDQEFEGAEIVVMRGGGELLGGLDDARAQRLAQRGARRDLDELLVPPLDRAFALPEMADRAVAVADDLHLDVARLADQPLDIDVAVAEGRLRFGLAARIGLGEPGRSSTMRMPRPPPPATALIMIAPCAGEEGPRVLQRGRPLVPSITGTPQSLCERLCLGLVAEQFQRFGDGPTKVIPPRRSAARGATSR